MRNISYLLILLFCFLLSGCSEPELRPAPVPDNYEESIREWKEYRIGVLTEPTGWLRLEDLIWLDEGRNSFGSGSDQDIRFPEGTIPEHAGFFVLENDSVIMNVDEGVEIYHEDEPVREMILLDGENRPHVIHENLEWYIDTRGDQHGVRVYNHDTPKADNFDGFPSYPLDEEWHLQGRFVHHPEEKTIEIVNVQGEIINRPSPGRVEFRVDGELHSLNAFETSSGLFLMFTDETSQTETYQAGRYMITDYPDGDGNVIVDFNKAYNPPCAFSRFTTCQFPPPQNRLETAIEAGEKRPVEWQGIEVED